MTPIQIAVPESLTAQKVELEATLAGIASEEEKLATQRKDIQVALQSITTAVAVLSGQPLPASKVVTVTGRKPMSPEARQRIAEGLRKSAQAKALAKAALVAAPANDSFAPAPADPLVEVSAPEEHDKAPAEVPVHDSHRGSRVTRKGARAK